MLPTYYKAGQTRDSEFTEVWFNGYREAECTEASARADGSGWITRYARDKNGLALYDWAGNRKSETIEGHVEIRRCA